MSCAVSTKKSIWNVKMISRIAVLGAIAVILMLFDFPLPIAPPFYKIDLSEVAVLIGGFALGPGPAVAIEGIKILLNLIINGSDTAVVGEIANFIIGCSFVLPATIIYHRNKDLKHAIIGLIIGMITLIAVGAIVNYFIMLPAYSYFYGMPLDVIIDMGNVINPNVDGLLGFVLLMTTPFNFIKGAVVSSIVLISYKRVSPLLKK